LVEQSETMQNVFGVMIGTVGRGVRGGDAIEDGETIT
jgi:hypothetical protein